MTNFHLSCTGFLYKIGNFPQYGEAIARNFLQYSTFNKLGMKLVMCQVYGVSTTYIGPCILIKITQCHFLDRTFFQNRTKDFDETFHVAWVYLSEGFGNSGRSGYSPVQKKGGRRPP